MEAVSVNNEIDICPICKIVVREEVNSVNCTMCRTWVHQECLHMGDEEFAILWENQASLRQIWAQISSIMFPEAPYSDPNPSKFVDT